MGSVVSGALGDLEGLLADNYSAIWRLCYRLSGNSDVADDLAQETCLRVVRHQKSFRGGSDSRTWLYRITRNVCLDHLKAVRRDLDLTTALAADAQPPGSQSGSDARDDRSARVHEALALLSIADREVLVLTRYCGLHYAELAHVIDTTPGAARVRAHRALTTLRDRYLDLERRDNALQNGDRSAS
jgi:RNA polymerase sigma-70 factor (ECF subfamily)